MTPLAIEQRPPINIPAARAICDAATGGPWVQGYVSGRCEKPGHEQRRHPNQRGADPCEYTCRIVTDTYHEQCCVSIIEPNITLIGWDDNGPVLDAKDAAFIAFARTALPDALDEISDLRAQLSQLAADNLALHCRISELSHAAGQAEGMRESLPFVKSEIEHRTVQAIAAWLANIKPNARTMRDFGVQNERVEQVAEMLAHELKTGAWKQGGGA